MEKVQQLFQDVLSRERWMKTKEGKLEARG